jgi:hypothetical protein
MEVLVSGTERGRLEVEGLEIAEALGERLRLHVEEKALGALIRSVEAAGGRVLSVYPIRQSLEDYFFQELGGATEAGPQGGDE